MYYLHQIQLSTRQTVISIDGNAIAPVSYAYLNAAPIIGADGERVANKNGWTLGPVETEQEAQTLAMGLAKMLGCDIEVNGKLLGLPRMGKSGKWASSSDAAAALGSIKTAKKAQSSAANGRKGGRPPKANPQ